MILRPIHIIWEEEILPLHRHAAHSAVRLLGRLANAKGDLRFCDIGTRWQTPYQNTDGTFAPYGSVDWYVAQGVMASTKDGYINSAHILQLLVDHPARDLDPMHPYIMIIARKKLYHRWKNPVDGKENDYTLIGQAQPHVGTIITVDEYAHLSIAQQFHCLRLLIVHELLHVFGLLPDARIVNVQDVPGAGRHCVREDCVMHASLLIEQKMTLAMRWPPVCGMCHAGFFFLLDLVSKPKSAP